MPVQPAALVSTTTFKVPVVTGAGVGVGVGVGVGLGVGVGVGLGVGVGVGVGDAPLIAKLLCAVALSNVFPVKLIPPWNVIV
ncbi:MAG: hypothetical protein E6Q32_12965 [Neisseriales bacterium]|nr:MAG: hypothetical protein E6Q32_12965 [Neisseriales bacterium]